MKPKTKKTIFTLVAVSLLAGCGSANVAEVGNAGKPDDPGKNKPTVGTVGISMKLAGTTSQAPAFIPTGEAFEGGNASFSVTDARVNVRHIEFDLPENSKCEVTEVTAPVRCDGTKIAIDGPFVFDLIAGTSSPSLTDVTLPAGLYKRIDIRIDDADPDDGLVDATDPLADTSMLASGTITAAAAGVDNAPFALDLKFNEDIRFESPNGISITTDIPVAMAINLDVTQWFNGVALDDCIIDDGLEIVDGVYQINEKESCSIENTIKENVKRSGRVDEEEYEHKEESEQED